jgi:tetratricopeptide (TPR) repeat protein
VALEKKVGALINAKKYSEAIPLKQLSLSILEHALGPDDPLVASSLSILASMYKKEGRYVDAEPLYQRSLAIFQKALGPDHLNLTAQAIAHVRGFTIVFASTLDNLAQVYLFQGRYADAEPLFKRSLAIREKVLGSDHPNVAISLSDLAELYQAQGRYADAEPLFKRSLTIREKALGFDHP